jgi:hypothetical protein
VPGAEGEDGSPPADTPAGGWFPAAGRAPAGGQILCIIFMVWRPGMTHWTPMPKISRLVRSSANFIACLTHPLLLTKPVVCECGGTLGPQCGSSFPSDLQCERSNSYENNFKHLIPNVTNSSVSLFLCSRQVKTFFFLAKWFRI